MRQRVWPVTTVLMTFSTVSSSKTIYGIRHGRSLANEWMSRVGNRWGDPTFMDDLSLVDSPLSEHGFSQATDLCQRLQSEPWIEDVEIILVSPLTRCLQTFEHGVRPAFTDGHIMPPVVALPLLTERVYTCSDTGRAIESLEQEFPVIDWSEARAHGEPWWYVPPEGSEYEEWRPNHGKEWYAVPGEPKQHFEERMLRLEEWLRQRPENNILMVCHWAVLRHWTRREIENCGIIKIEWNPETESLVDQSISSSNLQ